MLRICLKKIIFSDACCYAEADFTCERNEKIVHYMWDDFRKLKRTRNGSSNFIKLFRGSEWKIGELFTDNQNVVCIACKGIMVDELLQLAMSIFGVCVKHGML